MSTLRNPNRCGAITSSLPSPEELKTKYKQEVYFIKPRDLVKECIRKDILINPQLNKYFNTQYWLGAKFWTFDELIILMASEEPPFPHEIVDVFRDKKYYQLATKVRQKLAGKYNTTYKFTNHTAKLAVFNIDTDDIKQLHLKQISILTMIGYDQELFGFIKNPQLKTRIYEYTKLHKFAKSLSYMSLDERSSSYKKQMNELAKESNFFTTFPLNFSSETDSFLDDIIKFNDNNSFLNNPNFQKLFSGSVPYGDLDNYTLNDPFNGLKKYINTLTNENLKKINLTQKQEKEDRLDAEAAAKGDLILPSGKVAWVNYVYDERLGEARKPSSQDVESNNDLALDEHLEASGKAKNKDDKREIPEQERFKTAGRETSVSYNKVFDGLFKIINKSEFFTQRQQNQPKQDYIDEQSKKIAELFNKLNPLETKNIKIPINRNGKLICSQIKIKLQNNGVIIAPKNRNGDINKTEIETIIKKINLFIK